MQTRGNIEIIKREGKIIIRRRKTQLPSISYVYVQVQCHNVWFQQVHEYDGFWYALNDWIGQSFSMFVLKKLVSMADWLICDHAIIKFSK